MLVNTKVIWDLHCIYFEHSVLAYDVPQYPYLRQRYVFLTKHDHCVYFLTIAMCRSLNVE